MILPKGLNDLLGGVIEEAWIGIGSFLVLDLFTPEHGASVWIYLASWNINHDGIEVYCSETADRSVHNSSLNDLASGKVVRDFHILNDNEIHIELSGGLFIEIWEDIDSYGPRAEAIIISKSGDYVESLNFD